MTINLMLGVALGSSAVEMSAGPNGFIFSRPINSQYILLLF
jgi:hypothetical protein